MERRTKEETALEVLKALRRGWCAGSHGFRRELLLSMEGKLAKHNCRKLHTANALAKPERIIAQEMRQRRRQEADWLTRRDRDSVKLEWRDS